MNPGPATQPDPSSAEGRIRRRTVIALYLTSSAAVAALAPGIGRDLAWVPDWPVSGYLVWIANVVIVLSAIALARTHAPLGLQLAMAFAGPGLYVLLLCGLGAFFEESPVEGHVLMLGLSFGWLWYSEFLGALVAFVIALTSHRTSVFSRGIIRALGWFLVAVWLYLHGFGLAVNYWSGSQPYLDGLPLRIFEAGFVVAWGLSPLWLVAAIALILSSFGRGRRPARADTAVLVLVVGLIGLYFVLGFLD